MKLYIKNMVCDRCKFVIVNLLRDLNIDCQSISLGELDFGKRVLSSEQIESIKKRIEVLGFELIDNRKIRIIESIKKLIIELVHRRDEFVQTKMSEYLSDQLHYDYNHLSHLFSSVEGITIERYLINQKIEKVKELLVYDEQNLTEIAFQLGYSSLAHLSSQFKKVTGLTPSHFKKLKDAKRRLSLDKV